MIVVADTSPLNYLVAIAQSRLLEALSGRVLALPGVAMNDHRTPERAGHWIRPAPPRKGIWVTNFRASASLLANLLDRDRRRKS